MRTRSDIGVEAVPGDSSAARVASEDSGAAGGSLGAHREAIAAAANAALRQELPGDSAAALEEAVAAMELALKRRRLGR